MDFLGINVGKRDLHMVLLQDNQRAAKTVPNSPAGFAQLGAWLKNREALLVHACLESTGGWSEAVARSLHLAGHIVSIVNPSRIKAYMQSEMLRTKTDSVDAAAIARFCRMHRPDPWTPPTQETLALQGLVRRRLNLTELRAGEQNRLGAPSLTPMVARSIKSMIMHLSDELKQVEDHIMQLIAGSASLRKQRDLLISIPGIGATTAARILSEMPNIAHFRDAKAVAAFAGLSPRHHQSGSLCLPSRLAKAGNAALRTALYFPAIVAMQRNPILKDFAARLRERGKARMTVVAAAMRKLLTIAYGVLKSGEPFNVNYAGT